MLVAGIDIGAGNTKTLLMDEEGKVLGKDIRKTRADFEGCARDSLTGALQNAGYRREEVTYIATTGLGRYSFSERDIQITDLTTTGRGSYNLFPQSGFVLDMGYQSTRAIRLWKEGRVREFHVNTKCAAGSGAFLQRAAQYLEIPLEEMGSLSMKAKTPQTISSVCAVLAETEIINHLADGKSVEDILRGVHISLAQRALGQLKRVGLNGEIVFVGGVTLQEGMVDTLKEISGLPVLVPEEPQFVAALGAALLGWQRLKEKERSTAEAQRMQS